MRRLFVVGDRLGWSIDDDQRRLAATARRLGIRIGWTPLLRVLRSQPVFMHNHFTALHPRWTSSSHQLGLSYFHGRPGTPGYPEFDRAYAALRANPGRVQRLQVTHEEMHELVLDAGVDPSRVFRIPIGIDLERFPLGDEAARRTARTLLGIPQSAFVIGSFQKDGVGWAEGLEPKAIKGPDVLVAVLERLRLPELYVLLTGPARGWVRRELERLGIPYGHAQLASRDELASAYHALNVYLVTSRQEGGPSRCWRRWRPALPSSRRGSGRRRRSCVTERTDGSPTWTMSTLWSTRCDESAARATHGLPDDRPPSATRRSVSTGAGLSFSTDSCAVPVDRARVGRYARAAARWGRLLVAGRPQPGARIFYGHDVVPVEGEAVAGGTAKFQRLARRFPNRSSDFSVLYLGSTWLPRDLRPLLVLARRRGVPVVLNQNGVAYPGWAGDDTERLNAANRRALDAAAHVLYQSEFSKLSADAHVGNAPGSWEVLYNAVDVKRFTPAEKPLSGPPVLLLGGDQTQAYRLELALRTVALVPEARLLVTGRLLSDPSDLLDELGIRGRVELTGRYTQRDAPTLYRRAHVLLHTKVLDPCPSLVIEAMACGLPVVYPSSGGTPELVGDAAGIGVPHPESWERDEPPSPEALAKAVQLVVAERDRYAEAARTRAVERFDVEPWLERHEALFAELRLPRLEHQRLVGIERRRAPHMTLPPDKRRIVAFPDGPFDNVDESRACQRIRERLLVVDEFVAEVAQHVVHDEARQDDVCVVDEDLGCPGEIAALEVTEIVAVKRRHAPERRSCDTDSTSGAKYAKALAQTVQPVVIREVFDHVLRVDNVEGVVRKREGFRCIEVHDLVTAAEVDDVCVEPAVVRIGSRAQLQPADLMAAQVSLDPARAADASGSESRCGHGVLRRDAGAAGTVHGRPQAGDALQSLPHER